MINLYQSNMLDALLNLFLAVRQPQQDPLQPETILVPSKGMQRWLQLAMARKNGIAANVDFQLPGAFVWRLAAKVMALPRETAFDKETLAWRIQAILPTLSHLAGSAIQANWEAANEVGRYELAWRVADVFDQYLIYRPDWLQAWEQGQHLGLGDDEVWQAELWQHLAQGEPMHRAQAMQALVAQIKAGKLTNLPSRVVLFGVSSMPPEQWHILQALGQQITLDVFLLNPSEDYWGQLRRHDQNEAGHALLASLGQQGRDFINTVASSDIEEPVGAMAFVSPLESQKQILAALQTDLRYQTLRSESEKLALQSDDRSLQVHVCHNALREVEVLHDQLLKYFEDDASLMPDEVLVMCTDIQRYAPLIDAVFGQHIAGQKGHIPYTIADRRLAVEQPLLNRFNDLLSLPSSWFEVEAVLGLLEEPLLRRHFGLEESQLGLIRFWCEEMHLRWGRDAADRQAKNLAADVPFTWKDALTRLQLGFALPPTLADKQSAMFMDYMPADNISSGSQARILAGFSRFLSTLLYWEGTLKAQPRTLADWADTLKKMLVDFFGEESYGEPENLRGSRQALLQVHNALETLRRQSLLAKEAVPQPFAVIRQWLMRQLSSLESKRGFLQGAVTVCAMVPMRSLPFRFVAVLGMDDGVFPRQQKPWPFDLMEENPRAGDRSRRQDDRYLFLETLLAARDYLYVSYIGRSDIDGTIRPPSPVLAELMDQVRRTVEASNEQFNAHFYVRHFLQPFNPHYFQGGDRYFSFNQGFGKVSALVAGQQKTLDESPAFSQGLPDLEEGLITVTPAQFEQFLSNPARFFLRERLGVQIPYQKDSLVGDEPIELTNRRQLREYLLSTASDVQANSQSIRASGLLPSGEWGQYLFHEEDALMTAFIEKYKNHQATPVDPLFIDFRAGKVRILGPLNNMTDKGILRVSLANKIYANDWVNLYFAHLLMCATLPPRDASVKPEDKESSLLLGVGDRVYFPYVDKSRAIIRLKAYCEALEEGMKKPLPFFRNASAVRCLGGSVEAAWLGNDYATGDIEDPWNQMAWRGSNPINEDFERWSSHFYADFADDIIKWNKK